MMNPDQSNRSMYTLVNKRYFPGVVGQGSREGNIHWEYGSIS